MAFAAEKGIELSEADREKLRRYSGFGGLKFILNPAATDEDRKYWKKSDLTYFDQTKELYSIIRENAKDDREAGELIESVKRSVNTAFYTPQPVIDTIAKVMKDAGVEVRSMLDPSAGIGKFGDAFKKQYPGIQVTDFEKDLLTGKVLKALNPNDQVTIDGFEAIRPEQKGNFDIAASNIPFGDIAVFDAEYSSAKDGAKYYATKAIHNYFFMKSLDMVREGGFVAFITSRGFMDSEVNNAIREEISKDARLVGAFRLPDGMFRDEAGTDVGSDLVVLQKYTGYDKSLDPDTQAFCEVSEGFKAMSGEDWSDITMNAHWWKSMMAPDSEAFVATKMERGTDPYGKPTLVFTHEGGMDGITKLLSEYLKRDLYSDFVEYYRANAPKVEEKEVTSDKKDENTGKEQAQAQSLAVSAELTVKPVGLEREEAKVRHHTQAPVQLDLFSMWEEQEAGKESLNASPEQSQSIEQPKAKTLDEQRMDLYYQVRDAYETLYDTEAQLRQAQPELRERLNKVYDEFVEKFGHLNERKNARLIMNDRKGRDVLAIENVEGREFVKSDIFQRPVSFVAYEIDHADTPEDALFASLNRYGKVDLEYMSGLTGKTEQQLTEDLKGRIYYMPDGDYEISSKVLSGNVYDKLAYVDDALEMAKEHADDPTIVPHLEETKAALEQAIPQQIAFDDIGLQFGERWIPTEYYEDYIGKLFDTKMEIHYAEHIDEYSLKAENRYNLKIREEYCVRGEYKDYDGMALLSHAFHDTTPDIQKCVGSDANGDDLKGPDMEKIQLANAKIQEIREGFSEYLTNLPKEKRDELQEMYNRKFNCFVKAKYDGSHQTFPGIDMKALGSSRFNVKDIYKSQKDCVWMLLQNGGGICDHEVGTGKTLIMCMAAHEMHRLGLANKPMIIALKANVAEIAMTYQAAFPDDRILYASEKDFSPANRSKFFNNIKNNDYACVIMSHDQFGKIPQAAEVQRQILSDELRDIDEALDVLRNQGGNISGRMLTGLEKRKENLSAKMLELQNDMAKRKDDFVDFGMMGIDHIFVDESHQFKNLTFTTRHQRVSGLGNPAGSQKALNLLYAIRTIQNRTGKDLGATFLSGTTISNSLTELYLLFKYLRPEAMEQQGIHSFDAWAAVYAKKTSDYEFNVTNAVVQKERFRYFVKVPELATFYNEITDYRTGEDVGLDRPDMNIILHNMKPTADQQDFNQRLVQFAQTGDGELIYRAPLSDREQKGKMLIATDASRKASLDMRLVAPGLFGDDPDNKASHCARLVSEYYQKYNEQKGTQFIFSDLSTYKPGEWNIFSEIKEKLVNDYGIPENEIRFIQEAKNEKQRKELIKAMNEGSIRVLFGSTSTLGTGVNAQKRAVAVHHIDIPWRPSDLEQRNGRARRSGNEIAKQFAGNNVDIIIYAVERTLDSYKFNLLQNKQLFITQLKTNSLGSRVIDEGAMDEENGMNFAEYVAVLSGNDDLLQKAKLEKKIMALESERKTYMQARRETEWRLQTAQEKVEKNNTIIQNMTEDYDKFQKASKYGEDRTVLPGLTMPKVKEFTPDGAYNVEGMGAALQDAGRTIGNKDRKMGDVYGFSLMVDSVYMWDEKMRKEVYAGNKFYLQGHYQYEYNNGKIAMSKDNRLGAVRYGVQALEKIPGYIRQYQERNEKLQQDIAEYQRIAGKAWGKEDELKDLKHEMEALEKKIQASLDATTQNLPKPKEEPYKITKEGRYHTVTFERDAFPLVAIKEMRELADTGSWKNRGYVRCGHWDGDMMVSDPEVSAEFSLRQKAEEFIHKVVEMNTERMNDKEFVVALASQDTDGDKINQDNECIFAARKMLGAVEAEKHETKEEVDSPDVTVQTKPTAREKRKQEVLDILAEGTSFKGTTRYGQETVFSANYFELADVVRLSNGEQGGDMTYSPADFIKAVKNGTLTQIETTTEAKQETIEKPIMVYSLGQYGVGEHGEELRQLAHQVKEQGTSDAITEAVSQFSDLFAQIPEADREKMVIVPVPGKTGVAGYTDDIAYDLGDYMEIDSNNGLTCSAHPSLYDLKKENGMDNLPVIDFKFNSELPKGTIVVLLDNVLDTGHTLSQAAKADFGEGVEVRAAVLAHTDNYLQYHPEIEVKELAQTKEVKIAAEEIHANPETEETQVEETKSEETKPYRINIGEAPFVFGEYHVQFVPDIMNVTFGEQDEIAKEYSGEMRVTGGKEWGDFMNREDAEQFAEHIVSLNDEREQEQNAGRNLYELATTYHLEYLPLTLRLPVVVNGYDDGIDRKDLVISHAMITHGGDIDVYTDRFGAYDNKNAIALESLPEYAQKQVKDGLSEILEDDDRQMSVYVITQQVPDYALPAIVNGDFSNLDAEETKMVQEFMDAYSGHLLVPRDESPSFTNSPAFGQAADCVPVDIIRIASPKQWRDEQERITEKRADAEKDARIETNQQIEAGKQKVEKKDEPKVIAPEATLLVAALDYAKQNRGVWLNKCGTLSDEYIKQSRMIKPYEALKMLLQNDEKDGCQTVEMKKENSVAYRQVQSLKEKHPDALILVRGGDFYEAFGEDALKAARTLGITNSRRETAKGEKYDYAVFPHHALDVYLPKLVRAGYRIAICDQLADTKEDKEQAKAIYDRADKLVKALQKIDESVKVNTLLSTGYGSKSGCLYINSSRNAMVGKEKDKAVERSCDIYRAAVAFTGAECRLNRKTPEELLPADAQKYERLVQELATGIVMTRQGLPASLSRDSMEMIPYWQEQLKTNPRLTEYLERDVNNAMQTLHLIVLGKEVDYAAMRSESPTSEVSKAHTDIVQTKENIPTIAAEEITRTLDIGVVPVNRDNRGKVAQEVRMATGKEVTPRKTYHR